MIKFLLYTKVVLLLSLASCNDGTVIDAATSDSDVTDRVKATLISDESLRALAIDVNTRDGIVQLTGIVDTRQDIERAETVVQEVAGVRSINNELVLDARDTPFR
jgi:hyperosmotically inducible periplasmic protein